MSQKQSQKKTTLVKQLRKLQEARPLRGLLHVLDDDEDCGKI